MQQRRKHTTCYVATVLVVLLCILTTACRAQDYQHVELRDLIDTPTAGLLGKWTYDLDMRLFPRGGVLTRISVGLLSRVTIGLSYGGLNVIGDGDIDWYPRIGLQGKLRIKDESFVMPALAVGFDSQGYGAYDDEAERYQIKSRGVYAVLSKSFWMLGPLGLHAGATYSLEDRNGDDDISLFVGCDKDLVAGFVLLAEYDLGLNDDHKDGVYGTGNGYLNAAVRWTFAEKLSLECVLKNLVDNRENDPHVSREIRITYWNKF